MVYFILWSCLKRILNTGPNSIIQTAALSQQQQRFSCGNLRLKVLHQNKTGPPYCPLKISFSSPAVLQLLLALLSGAVKREAAELIKHEGKRALKDCSAPAYTDTLEALDTHLQLTPWMSVIASYPFPWSPTWSLLSNGLYFLQRKRKTVENTNPVVFFSVL